MITALDRLTAARRALVEASQVAGVSQTRRTSHQDVLSTGLASLDETLAGGVPRGRIVEVTGGSGRLSFTLAWLTHVLHTTDEPVAFVDPADALDPRTLAPEDRARVLWVRPHDVRTATKCADQLLDGGGFALVGLYLVGVAQAERVSRSRPVGSASWVRLAQRAEKARSVVVVTLDAGSVHAPGSFAHMTLCVQSPEERWCEGGVRQTTACRVEVSRNRASSPTGVSPWSVPIVAGTGTDGR